MTVCFLLHTCMTWVLSESVRAFLVCVFRRKELQHQHGYFLFPTLLSVGLGAWVGTAPRGAFQAGGGSRAGSPDFWNPQIEAYGFTDFIYHCAEVHCDYSQVDITEKSTFQRSFTFWIQTQCSGAPRGRSWSLSLVLFLWCKTLKSFFVFIIGIVFKQPKIALKIN